MTERLEQEARRARQNAYIPYSHFGVGAAVQVGDQIFAGCNVENASFGLSLCAERNAIFRAVAAGYQHLDTLLVIADTPGPVSPCGACRQVMAEFFAPDAKVVLMNLNGDTVTTFVSALLPGAFTKGDMPK